MPDLYLLTTITDRPKATPIAFNRNASGDDYGRLYTAWEAHLKLDKSKFHNSQCVSIYRDQVTPQGLPYSYDLCCDGGLYSLWSVSEDEQRIIDSNKYLRRSFDVVSLDVYRLTLVQWEPTVPFETTELPEWISQK